MDASQACGTILSPEDRRQHYFDLITRANIRNEEIDTLICKLRAEKIVNALSVDDFRRSYTCAFFESLPDELLVEVFHHFISIPRTGSPRKVIGSVCQRWRTILYGRGEFWTEVDYWIGKEGFDKLGLEKRLALSKSCLITFSAHTWSTVNPVYPDIMEAIASVAGRLKALELHLPRQLDICTLSPLRNDAFRWLQKLVIDCGDDDIPPKSLGVFLDAPCLKDVTLKSDGDNASTLKLFPLPCDQIEVLSIRFWEEYRNGDFILQYLSQFTSLRSLSVETAAVMLSALGRTVPRVLFPHLFRLTLDISSESDNDLYSDLFANTTIPALEYLCISTWFRIENPWNSAIMVSFRKRSDFKLKELVLNPIDADVQDIYDFIGDSTSLNRLQLGFYDENKQTWTLFSDISNNQSLFPALRSLEIHCEDFFIFPGEIQDEVDRFYIKRAVFRLIRSRWFDGDAGDGTAACKKWQRIVLNINPEHEEHYVIHPDIEEKSVRDNARFDVYREGGLVVEFPRLDWSDFRDTYL